MRVIVCGSRGWSNRQLIADRLVDFPGDTTIVHGDARGADRTAADEARKAGLVLEPHPAEWDKHGEVDDLVPCWCPPEKKVCKLAGFRRNEKMAALGADLCIAFWDGSSRGTVDMMERAARHGIPIDVVRKHFPNRPRREQLQIL